MKFSRMADKFIFKWKPTFSPFRITYQFWIWPISSYLKELPCALRTPSTCWCSQWKLQYSVKKKRNMNVHLDIICEVFKNSRQIIFKWKPRLSPFRIAYQFWIWPISSYLKEPPCALRTPSTCWCSQWKQYNTVWKKEKYECTLGYNLWSFQEWPTNLYSNERLGSPLSE